MDPMNPIAVQNSIRRNATERYDYLQTIQSWQKDMDRKEDQFGKQTQNKNQQKQKQGNGKGKGKGKAKGKQKGKGKGKGKGNSQALLTKEREKLPPIRNETRKSPLITEITHSEMKQELTNVETNGKAPTQSESKKALITPATITNNAKQNGNGKSKSTKANNEKAKKTDSSAHTYDHYKKWDKLDINAELEKLDKDDSNGVSNSQTKVNSNNTRTKPKIIKANDTGNGKSPLITEISSHELDQTRKLPKSKSTKTKSPPKKTEPTCAASSAPKKEKLSEYDESVERMKQMEKQLGIAAPARNKGQSVEQQSEALKNEGNVHYTKGRYTLAIEAYSKAIKIAPRNPKLYSNRALVRLKCNDFELAERDCSECIKLDAKFVKALYRRGVARNHLKRCNEAIADFERILEIEANNNSAQKEITAIKAKLAKIAQKEKQREREKQKQKELRQKQMEAKTAAQANAKTVAKSNEMRRITIVEGSDSDSDSSDEAQPQAPTQAPPKPTKTQNQASKPQAPAQAQTQRQAIKITNGNERGRTDTSKLDSDEVTDESWCNVQTASRSNSVNLSKTASGSQSPQIISEPKATKQKSKTAAKAGLKTNTNVANDNANTVDAKQEEMRKDGLCKDKENRKSQQRDERQSLLSYLKSIESISNFIEFEKLWNRCHIDNIGGNDPTVSFEFQTQILWKMRQKNWAKLFQNMVHDALFTQILLTIHYIVSKKKKVKAGWRMLHKLSSIGRFQMLVMFMEEKDMARLKEMKQICVEKSLNPKIFEQYMD